MKKILNKLNNIEEYIMVITFPLMLLFIFLSTVFRYFEIGSLTWAEEASRFLMIWLAYAGISYGFKNNAHLGLSFLVNRFNERIRKVLFFVRAAIIFIFGAVISYYTFILISTQISYNQVSPSLGIQMWIVYASLLFCSIMIMIRITMITVESIKKGIYPTGEGGEMEV